MAETARSKREYKRLWHQQKLANMTPEELENHRADRARRNAESKAKLTEEQKSRYTATAKQKLQEMTPEGSMERNGP